MLSKLRQVVLRLLGRRAASVQNGKFAAHSYYGSSSTSG